MSGQVKTQEQLGSVRNVKVLIGTVNVKPCVKCGAVDRTTSDGRCRPCKAEYRAKYSTEHIEQTKACSVRYYADHTELIKAKAAKYRAENVEIGKARNAKYRAEHLAQAKAHRVKYYTEHPEYSEKYRTEHAEQIGAYSAKYYTENAEQEKARCAKWKSEHPGYDAKYYAEHLDQEKVRTAKYQAEYPERARARSHKRRARVLEVGGKFSAAEIRALLKQQKRKCSVCIVNIDKDYHIDHIMPLALGGHNGITNIQLLCPRCNLSKKDKHPIDFMQSRGFLL